MKRKPTDWETILTNQISDRGLIQKIQRTPTTQQQSDFKMGKRPEFFFRNDI